MSLDALIEKFRGVALDRVEKMDVLLVAIEQDGTEEAIEELQREIHTLKGEAKMMGFADVNLVSHLTEHLILEASARQFAVKPEATETMFEGFDVLRALMTKSPAGASAPIDLAGFVDRVTDLRRPLATAEPSDAAFERPKTAPRKRVRDGSLLRIQAAGSTRVDLAKLERLGEVTGEILLTSRRTEFQLSELEQLGVAYSRLFDRLQSLLPSTLMRETRGLGHDFDAVLGELHTNIAQTQQWGSFLDAQTRELRHLPLERALQHYPRAVRDLAAAQGKKVRFVQEVVGVEVDRVVLNGLADPLLHLIRNAVDHGIEAPADRLRQSKPVEGTVELYAEMAGDSIRVILRDDGAGIDPQHIAAKAVERELISAEEAATMGRDELLGLIFEPGFSTREHVTDISGRGIGMDVVRRQVGAIGGTVELHSEPGEGTAFTLVLPVSSSVGSVLTFIVDGAAFGIPTQDVQRVEFIDANDVVNGSHVVVQGEEEEEPTLVPLVDWKKVLGGHRLPRRGRLTILHVRRGSRSVAMAVDDVGGEREAMTRPLGRFLAGVRMCRGVAITNAGDVVPLLNVNELLSPENSISTEPARTVRATMELPKIVAPKQVLIVEDSEITRALVAGILRDMGLRVVEAEDGLHGWETLNQQRFDLVLSDVQMPRMDGLELLEKIRADPRFRALPVVMLTTLNDVSDKEAALKLGASAYLVKLNFQEKELIRTVRRFLE
jgi:chemotaxis protein histidine kinase CheA